LFEEAHGEVDDDEGGKAINSFPIFYVPYDIE
jgi:hypothetical protein